MKKTFTAKLSVNSIKQLQKELQEYRQSIPSRVAKALSILADKGISVAEETANSSGTFGKCVEFTKTVPEIVGNEVTAIMKGIDLGIDMSWQQADGSVKTVSTNALMMLEFGSGRYADSEHRGTFPDSTHGLDPNGWYFKPAGSNQWVHSYGYKPKQPMLKAYLEMEEQVRNAFEEAFR